MSNRTAFDSHDLPALPAPLVQLLPPQGSVELQNDGPGKTHQWHYHTVAEELFVLAGSVMLVWKEQDAVEHRPCGAGTRITLPAQTVHASTAGPDGAVYVIRPLEGGADTVWLTPDARPTTAAA
jgi:quercetin dioxygenase-like cupin family protein